MKPKVLAIQMKALDKYTANNNEAVSTREECSPSCLL